MMIAANVIQAAHKFGVKKLLNLGSSCIYPKSAPQPLKEEYLLTSSLELTNEPYAIAKIAAIKLCRYYNEQYGTNFISVMATNLYGPNDNFDSLGSHLLPALISKFHQAKINNKDEVSLWGTGKPKRELLHVDDLASACLFLMNNYNNSEIINVGTGKDFSIKELAETVQKIVGFKGKIAWDTTKPDGNPRKLLDVSKINKLGWKNKIELKNGINSTYKWFLENNKII